MKNINLWAARTNSIGSDDELDDDDDSMFLSCSDSSDSDEEFFTPPTSPVRDLTDSDDEMNVFEESFEHLDEEKGFKLFINK